MKLNRRSILLLAGCLVLLVKLVGLIFSQQREPRYQGRSLSSWLEDVGSTGPYIINGRSLQSRISADRQSNAVYAIRQMGAETYPFLMEMLKAEDGPVRKTILQKLGQTRATKLGLVNADEKHQHYENSAFFRFLLANLCSTIVKNRRALRRIFDPYFATPCHCQTCHCPPR